MGLLEYLLREPVLRISQDARPVDALLLLQRDEGRRAARAAQRRQRSVAAAQRPPGERDRDDGPGGRAPADQHALHRLGADAHPCGGRRRSHANPAAVYGAVSG